MESLPSELKMELLKYGSLSDIFDFCSVSKDNLLLCKKSDFWNLYLLPLNSRERVDTLIEISKEFPYLFSSAYEIVKRRGPMLNFDTVCLLIFYLEMANITPNIEVIHIQVPRYIDKTHQNPQGIIKAKEFIRGLIADLNTGNLAKSLNEYATEYHNACIAFFGREHVVKFRTNELTKHVSAIEDYITLRIPEPESILPLINMLNGYHQGITRESSFLGYMVASLVKTYGLGNSYNIVMDGIKVLRKSDSYFAISFIYTGLVDNLSYQEVEDIGNELDMIHDWESIFKYARNPVDKKVLDAALKNTSEVYKHLYNFYSPMESLEIVRSGIRKSGVKKILKILVKTARKIYEFQWALELEALMEKAGIILE